MVVIWYATLINSNPQKQIHVLQEPKIVQYINHNYLQQALLHVVIVGQVLQAIVKIQIVSAILIMQDLLLAHQVLINVWLKLLYHQYAKIVSLVLQVHVKILIIMFATLLI